jgi:hypothetical protein
VFEEELEKINKKEKEELRSTNRRDQSTDRELAKIYEYKKKLIKLLSKLKNREIAMKEVTICLFSSSKPTRKCTKKPFRGSRKLTQC